MLLSCRLFGSSFGAVATAAATTGAVAGFFKATALAGSKTGSSLIRTGLAGEEALGEVGLETALCELAADLTTEATGLTENDFVAGGLAGTEPLGIGLTVTDFGEEED